MIPTEHPDHRDGDPTSDGAADEENEDACLNRTGRLFGGLVADIRRKAPWYLSDFRDGLHIQCLASAFFMYFGCLVPMVMFGGLLGIVTENNIAVFECLVSGAVCGVTYHFFSGQPLTIISSTGPVLVFETLVYRFCMQFGWYYLGFRFWIGIWISVSFLIIVAFDLSFLVRYITRFTEESFTALIAIIFIYEAFTKQFQQSDFLQMMKALDDRCACRLKPESDVEFSHEDVTGFYNQSGELELISTAGDCLTSGGQLVGDGCDDRVLDRFPEFYSNLFFIGTFLLSLLLKQFKKAQFLPFLVRSCISDFAVVVTVFLMVGLDAAVGLKTLKLQIPATFRPTRPDRDWIIDPFKGECNPWITVVAAFPPGVLAAILMFMDQHIPTVIITRKEKKLKKGSGYHLDLLIITVQVAVCSAFGTPWFVGATILSINHVNSLTMETETSIPGAQPVFLGIREQRVTGILVFVLVGLSIVIAQVLKFVPMSVLYGVLLYMGVASFQGMQFVGRLRILLLPKKCWEKDCAEYGFLQKVEMRRIRLFTVIQILCVVALLVIKEIPLVSILFPLLVVAACVVRKALDKVFTYEELLFLDDILPGSKRECTNNGALENTGGGVELQTVEGCMIPEEPNDVTTAEAPNDVMLPESISVMEHLVPDAMPPAYDTVIRHSEGRTDDLLPDAMPPAYNEAVVYPANSVTNIAHLG